MRQPHPVSIFDRRANVLAVDIPMFLRKTGIPQSGVFGVLVREVRGLLDRMTKAGRADHRAIRAGEATSRHFIPSRMFVGLVEGLRQARVIEPSDLTMGAGFYTLRCFTR